MASTSPLRKLWGTLSEEQKFDLAEAALTELEKSARVNVRLEAEVAKSSTVTAATLKAKLGVQDAIGEALEKEARRQAVGSTSLDGAIAKAATEFGAADKTGVNDIAASLFSDTTKSRGKGTPAQRLARLREPAATRPKA